MIMIAPEKEEEEEEREKESESERVSESLFGTTPRRGVQGVAREMIKPLLSSP
jgi:hypothetical protein